MSIYDNLINRLKNNTPATSPVLPGIQMDENGNLYETNIMPMNYGAGDKITDRIKNGVRNFNLSDALLGKAANPTDNIGELENDTISVGVSSNPRVGGLFNDITAGARENFNNKFDVSNLENKTGLDGRKKGVAYRLGEGLGTIGRVAESPLGRGLITAGLIGAVGGNPLQTLAFGTSAGMQNQQLRNQDKMYRNEMIANAQNSLRNSPEFNTLSQSEQEAIYKEILGDRDYEKLSDVDKQAFESALKQALNNRLYENQQAQLANIENNVNGLRGYVTGDTYNNFIKAQQLRDNADYRNMMANLQMQNNQALQDFRKDQAIYQQQKDAADRADRAATRALTARGQDMTYGLGMARLAADERKAAYEAAAGKPLSDSQVNELTKIDVAQDDMRRIINKYSDPAKNNLFGVKGYVRRNPITSGFDPGVSELKQDVDLFRKTVAKAKEGGRLTDQDQRYYEKALLNPNLTRNKFLELAKDYYSNQERQRNITLDNYAKQGRNVNNFRQTTTTNNGGWAF
jgi:hypothetical protein